MIYTILARLTIIIILFLLLTTIITTDGWVEILNDIESWIVFGLIAAIFVIASEGRIFKSMYEWFGISTVVEKVKESQSDDDEHTEESIKDYKKKVSSFLIYIIFIEIILMIIFIIIKKASV